jgi:hypothetical protein
MALVPLMEYLDPLGAHLVGYEPCNCVCVHVMHVCTENDCEMGEGEYTISGKGAGGTASHVGDLRLGSDAKCRFPLGQRRSMQCWRRRWSFPSLTVHPVDRTRDVGGVWLAANLVTRVCGPHPLYIMQCDRGSPTS